jgi:hypothetical protein
MCGVVFGIPYMYMMDVIFMQRQNQYFLIKVGKYFIRNAHKGVDIYDYFTVLRSTS